MNCREGADEFRHDVAFSFLAAHDTWRDARERGQSQAPANHLSSGRPSSIAASRLLHPVTSRPAF